MAQSITQACTLILGAGVSAPYGFPLGPTFVNDIVDLRFDKKGRYFFGRSPHHKVVHITEATPEFVVTMVEAKISEGNASNLKGHAEVLRA